MPVRCSVSVPIFFCPCARVRPGNNYDRMIDSARISSITIVPSTGGGGLGGSHLAVVSTTTTTRAVPGPLPLVYSSRSRRCVRGTRSFAHKVEEGARVPVGPPADAGFVGDGVVLAAVFVVRLSGRPVRVRKVLSGRRPRPPALATLVRTRRPERFCKKIKEEKRKERIEKKRLGWCRLRTCRSTDRSTRRGSVGPPSRTRSTRDPCRSFGNRPERLAIFSAR